MGASLLTNSIEKEIYRMGSNDVSVSGTLIYWTNIPHFISCISSMLCLYITQQPISLY